MTLEEIIQHMLELIPLPFDEKLAIMGQRGAQYETIKQNAVFFVSMQALNTLDAADTRALITAMHTLQSSFDTQKKQEAYIMMQALNEKYGGLKRP